MTGMGEEIDAIRFDAGDYERFAARLHEETALLTGWLAAGRGREAPPTCGFELEAWLLDRHSLPWGVNQRFLARVADPLVVPELSTFNVELNGVPQPLGPGALDRLAAGLGATWRRCQAAAHDLGGTLVAIGTLPTIRNRDLDLAHLTPLNRYRALNDRVLARRGGRPIALDIVGRERLRTVHRDIMLEAGTTSFQVHLQVPADELPRYHNASQVLSAPLVAIAANAPFLFGRSLWDETRVPLFEQAVDGRGEAQGPARVTFGSGYLERSAAESWAENARDFPVLLPLPFGQPPEELRHLRLHNGTLWRWNRPLIGFAGDGSPWLRMEQRVMPAGPSIADMIANAALYLGAARALATLRQAPEASLPFALARANFYAAARDGLEARIAWLDGATHAVATVLREEILPLAAEGLRQYGLDAGERERWLGIVAARLRTGQTGAAWQQAWVARHGADFRRLVATYLEHQRSGAPVHEWPV